MSGRLPKMLYYPSSNCMSFQYFVYHNTFGKLKESKGKKIQSLAVESFIFLLPYLYWPFNSNIWKALEKN